jgi:hypothetical protein
VEYIFFIKIFIMKSIVIDKNIIYSLSRDNIKEYFGENTILISDAFTFETVKDDPKKRSRLYSKLLEISGSIKIIPSVNHLLRYEIKHKKACGKPSNHIIARDISIIKELSDPNWSMSQERINSLKIYSERSDLFRGILMRMISFMYKNYKDKSLAEENLKRLYDGDIKTLSFVNKLINNQRSNLISAPNLRKFPKNSVTYRFFQIYWLYSLEMRCRYENIEVIVNSAKATQTILHDVHDLNYLILAALEGNFCTKEEKLMKFWNGIQSPEGLNQLAF